MSDLKSFLQRTEVANVVPVVETISADLLTPLSVYLKLAAGASNSFLLESVEGGKSLARYSFIGAGSRWTVRGGSVSTLSNVTKIDVSFFDYLRDQFSRRHAETDADLPAFIGGAIGYLGFDCCEWFEPSLKSIDDAGEGMMMFYDTIVAFDHAKQVVNIISLVFPDHADDPDDELPGMFEEANERNRNIRTTLETGEITIPKITADGSSANAVSNWERRDFENAVVKIKELINAGECYQAVLSQCITRKTSANPVSIYRALRSLNPSPYMFLLDFGEKQVIGASPEMLVRCEGDRLEYRPIAGTRPRGKTAAEDEALAEEMRLDKKEVAEHLMLVDLGRNDLGRVAEYGTVKVESLMTVEKYSHVQHLVSSLSAKLRNGLDRFDALAACFPAGTVSGAPKVCAMEIIRDLEPTSRGVYAGAVGYFDYSGNMDTCIAIRTLVLENGIAKIQAGAGIVADSVPELEFDETVNKAKGLMSAIDIAESGAV